MMMTGTLILRVLGLITSLGFGYLLFEYEGAGKEAPRAVSGEIQVAGRPLTQGTVAFLPFPGTHSTIAATIITDGAYEIDETDGLRPGKYLVSISGIDLNSGLRAVRQGGDARAQLEDPVPARFNKQSEIEVEVTADDGVVGFDFDLK
jgi:hypothetical protein